jgi:hypothetical protein
MNSGRNLPKQKCYQDWLQRGFTWLRLGSSIPAI